MEVELLGVVCDRFGLYIHSVYLEEDIQRIDIGKEVVDSARTVYVVQSSDDYFVHLDRHTAADEPYLPVGRRNAVIVALQGQLSSDHPRILGK